MPSFAADVKNALSRTDVDRACCQTAELAALLRMGASVQTDGARGAGLRYTASMHAEAILKHAGRGTIDFMLVNNAPISAELRKQYAAQDIYPVAVDEEAINALGIGFVAADIISQTDAVRHDPDKLSRNVMRMVYDFRVN